LGRRRSGTGVEPLRVTVLGMSTTAGCGALDPQRTCDIGRSWSRKMLDLSSTPIDLTVFSKNAVDPSYYARCTGQYVSASTELVLIEAFQSLWTGIEALEELVAAVRALAPRAVIAFLVWLMPDQDTPTMRSTIDDASARLGVDQLSVPRLAQGLTLSASQWRSAMYAAKGRDHHPSPMGHTLLALLAARYIVTRERAVGRAAQGSGDIVNPAAAATTGSVRHLIAVGREVCINSAADLPVRWADGGPSGGTTCGGRATCGAWRLVDEGQADKGVQKLGWLSTNPGDELVLGPLPLPPAVGTCAGVFVHIGFLQSTRPGLGALAVSCSGCNCTAEVHPRWQAPDSFPLLHGDISRLHREAQARLGAAANRNITVTGSASFQVELDASRECLVSLRHMPAEADSAIPSRVRVDSLAIVAPGRVEVDRITSLSNYPGEHKHAKVYSKHPTAAQHSFLHYVRGCLAPPSS